MISNELSNKVLTVGCECTVPKGGIAVVLNTYMNKVYSPFRFVKNSSTGNMLVKVWDAVCAYLKCEWLYFTDKNIKILHIHTASYNSFKRSSWYISQAKRHNIKVVCHIHGGGFKDYYAKEKNFVDSVLAQCDALATLSNSWKKFYEDTVGHNNVHVVPNIIDDPVIKKVDNDGKFHLLYMGHIYKAKGIFDLAEVILEHHDEYRGKLMLDIGGGMYDVEVLKKMIKDNNLEDVISFHGWISGDKKLEFLSLADAFILPSYTEGVPISILEAESYGLPILSTQVGGIPEIVEDGENGCLFTPGDKVAIKNAIDKVLYNSAVCRAMGDKSKQMSRGNLPEEVVVALNSVYESL